ncbi:MAG TPA: hypothetical protein VNS63_01415 [Blastocatellia bacterium]|nr:hypothetical protein [Blastocatellia bacterium]
MYRKMIALLLAFFAAACSWQSKAPPEDVDKAAALFYQRLAEADYDAIYKDTAKGFKEKKTRDQIIESLKEIASNGKVLNYARVSMGFEGEEKDPRVAAVYATNFERRVGNLTLYFVDESGEWRLIGFALKLRG